jgi:hypothetical protein
MTVELRAMRCLACGANMILVNVVRDDTMAVAGFEHRTFMCSECHDVERRLAFNKVGAQEAPTPLETAPPLTPPLAPISAPPLVPRAPADHRSAAGGLFTRVLARLRGH